MPLSEEDVETFTGVSRKTIRNLRKVINNLKLVSAELNRYGTQTAGDIRRGQVRIGEVYVPLETAYHMIFIDHFPMSYIDNTVTILDSYNKTRPLLSKWFLARSFMENIYDRAKVSVCDFDAVATNQVPKVKRFRMLTVLDFKLSMATHITEPQWYSDYIAMRNYVSDQEITKDSDMRLFPASRGALGADSNRGRRVQLFSELSRAFALDKPPEYKLIYENTSRLIHGNPMQMLVSERVSTQWRERFLLHGMFIRSCIELLKLIEETVILSESTHRKNLALRRHLEHFFENELKPTWRNASSIELA